MTTKFKEIEFKYSANSIDLKTFVKFAQKHFKRRRLVVNGRDMFFGSKAQPKAFMRHRVGEDMNQLTLKIKTGKNNVVRTEHNIDLKRNVKAEHISAYCEDLGFDYNTTILKKASIYKADDHILVYYLCYDVNAVHLGNFIEIEMSEDVDWPSEKAAKKELVKLEKKYKKLGIGPRRRIKESLYELFRR